ncbi:Heme sensor protein HssS [Paenibacillus sp. CECT 9249]|uniref:HAMP domain-containing sensor histidine kinase n=1 Tax=Paenibacillus sp. CECT 9249 TaxID=2845385 RepID=UPI001E514E5B|nr:HAMP domain-containing sensor histidine kinase [Paenibacillus sp. CECT 9249]CAH0118032.1 Heme sensor protein HssS [Paenibacillus sp. CECT 9249]
MIKSLYIRIVLMFLAAVIVSLIAAAVLTGYMYEKALDEKVQDSMVTLGQGLINVYERAGVENRALLMDDVKELLHGMSLRVFTDEGEIETYGTQNRSSVPIDREKIRQALNGETVRGKSVEGVFVGLGFRDGDRKYALFVEPADEFKDDNTVGNIILTMLGIVLAAGSLFFVIEATFLVRPLRKMTEATRRMAKGDFDSDLKVKRKDELGVLVQSFDDMRRQLKQMEQIRQDFVSNVSHEIQSPLTSIGGFAKALKNDRLVKNDRDRYVDIILSETERLSRLSDNLLRLASLDSDHHPFQPETYRLDEQIRQAVVSCEPQWSAKLIAVDLDLPTVKLTADRDQLGQVWINLLGNSIKFTPEGGEISIRIRQDVRLVSVTFADTGIGISPDDQKYIFQRFYKADRSRNRNIGGSGLGLAIVQRIILLHNGTIRLHSEVGKGTAITVTLPYDCRAKIL